MFDRYGIAMLGDNAALAGEWLELCGIRAQVLNHVVALVDCSQLAGARAALLELGVS